MEIQLCDLILKPGNSAARCMLDSKRHEHQNCRRKHLDMEIFSIVVLSISGLLIFTFAGILRLINPIKNYLKNTGIKLDNEVNLLSEARGMSSVMMFCGVIIVSGIFITRLTMTSHVVAILLFLGYAFGRSLSIGLDGKPNKLLINGLISEMVLGSLNIYCLVNILAGM